MSNQYTHIIRWERWQIYAMLNDFRYQKHIALKLWRSPSTVSREIKRWTLNWSYQPMYAQREYEKRRSEINKWRNKIKSNAERLQIIVWYMENDRWSPDSIAGFKREIEKVDFVCTTTIYNYINIRQPSLKKHLKYKKWYKKKWVIDKRWKPKTWFKSIEERPLIVETRERLWDMEIDTIHSSWSERKWGVVTIVDRKSKYLLWDKVERRTARKVWDVLIQLMKNLPKEKLQTITSDNGKEFYDFIRVESVLKTPIFFAHPYASSERGTNEQTNWMLRVFFPKWTDFSKVSREEIQKAIRIINHKPRKSLWYKTAHEVFHENI